MSSPASTVLSDLKPYCQIERAKNLEFIVFENQTPAEISSGTALESEHPFMSEMWFTVVVGLIRRPLMLAPVLSLPGNNPYVI